LFGLIQGKTFTRSFSDCSSNLHHFIVKGSGCFLWYCNKRSENYI